MKYLHNSYFSITLIYYAWNLELAKSGYPTNFGQSTTIEATTTTGTTGTTGQTITVGCNFIWIFDGYCDDINNKMECTYDGGDCCGPNVNTQYCTECSCLDTNGGKVII